MICLALPTIQFTLLLAMGASSGCVKQSSIANPADPASVPNRQEHVLRKETLMAFDDPGNPYVGDYQEWDYWILEHIATDASGHLVTKPVLQNPESFDPHNIAATPMGLGARVDANSCVIPQLRGTQEWQEAIGNCTEKQFGRENTWVYAQGMMPAKLQIRLIAEEEAIEASYYKPIPNWLIANPPRAAMLLPNGDIVTDGPLGSGTEAAMKKEEQELQAVEKERAGRTVIVKPHDSNETMESTYYRYDSTGTLVSQTSNRWVYLYLDYEPLRGHSGRLDLSKPGIVELYRNGELVESWSYDGHQLASGGPMPPSDNHYYQFLTTGQLQAYYAVSKGVENLVSFLEAKFQ